MGLAGLGTGFGGSSSGHVWGGTEACGQGGDEPSRGAPGPEAGRTADGAQVSVAATGRCGLGQAWVGGGGSEGNYTQRDLQKMKAAAVWQV